MQKPLLIVIPVAALAIIIGGYFLLGGNKNRTTAPSDFDSIVAPPPSSASVSDSLPHSPIPPTPLNPSTPLTPTPAPIPTIPPIASDSLSPSGSSTATPSPLTPAPMSTGEIAGFGGEPLTPATPIPSPTPTSVKTYKIQPGDTLATIAAKFLGSSSKWEQLAKANPGINPYSLKIGQVIHLPASSLIPAHGEHGYDAAGPMAEDPPALSSAAPATSSTTPTGAKTYLVKEGDTLWSIAQSHYGDGSQWSLILKANRRQLNDASKLKPGMKLVIPPSSANSDSAQ